MKKLLAANFGRLKNNPVKQGKVYSEYERLSGITHGGSRPKNSVLITQSEIAKQLGISVDTIQNLKKLQTLLTQKIVQKGKLKNVKPSSSLDCDVG
ncbi:hypothetical protein [Clostridium tagluense]|uniref:hypothetical protein n=1 Tax=Clostridium tagluense TaxID=360422 RepID=UPI001C6E2213|nr:hypothetical protein [Clostridium tagluense]MBW9154890.1 hypothetical protein [Clostridium tagluense]WLC64345.1 hypothetical protein KTC93_15905 [Clostridium tagluense]